MCFDTFCARTEMLAVLVVLALLAGANTQLVTSNHLKHFARFERLDYSREDLHSEHLRVQRSSEDDQEEIIVEFSGYDQQFTLVLRPDGPSNAARVRLVQPDGSVRTVPPHQLGSEMYQGHVRDRPGSAVHGYIHEGVFDGVIRLPNSSAAFHVEGAWKFFGGVSPAAFHSILYSEDDVRPHQPGGGGKATYCGHLDLLRNIQDSLPRTASETRTVREANSRSKRVTPTGHTVCQLNLAVDSLFYSNVGSSSAVITRNEVNTILQAVNNIFTATDFNFDGSADGVSFYVAEITIFTSANQPTTAYANPSITVNDFLNLWSAEDHGQFCLALLLTYRDFAGGVLGLAWVAEPPGGNVGGVCTARQRISGEDRSLNTAIVTFLNFGSRQSRSVITVTIAHELGHNFGSPHDPMASGRCSPGGSGGNFIMYFSATDGSQTNNNRFSDCSISSIRSVLQSSRSSCFIPGANQCGNGIVEPDNGEVCDCGSTDSRESCDAVDPCCSLNCELLATSQCTTRGPTGANPCCDEQCSFLGSAVICQEESDCLNQVSCNGASATCNMSDVFHKPDSILCDGNSSTCISGECKGSICTVLSTLGNIVTECQCSGSQLCDVCCLVADACTSTFDLQGVAGTHRSSGRPCNAFTGYCDASVPNAPPTCVALDNNDFIDILKNLFTEETLQEIILWLQNYWYIPVAIIVVVTIIIILLPLTYRKKNRKRIQRGMNTIRRRMTTQRPGRQDNNVQQAHTGGVGVTRRNSMSRNNIYRPKKLTESEGVRRIRYFFPHADEDTVRTTMRRNGNEADSVRQLLEMGYPLKRQNIDVLPVHP